MHVIDIARDFSPTPGGRYRHDGVWSGEQFREDILLPALAQHEKVVVDLDDAVGFTTSFLDEVFGAIARQLGKSVLERVIPRAARRPRRAEKARQYLERGLSK